MISQLSFIFILGNKSMIKKFTLKCLKSRILANTVEVPIVYFAFAAVFQRKKSPKQ